MAVALPNPARSIEERIEVYDRLKGNLGTLSIVSVESDAAGAVVVKLQSSSGAPATATFNVEAQAPYRLTTISFRVGG
jgi:hypothetical protein